MKEILVNSILFHFASGASLFSGASCLILALAFSFKTWGRRGKMTIRLGLMLGLILIIVSSTPFIFGFYVALVALTLACLPSPDAWPSFRRWALIFRGSTITLALLLVAWELPHWRTPSLTVLQEGSCLYVLGDSLSAGLADNERTWPLILQEQHDLEVINLAQAGSTTGMALLQADQVTSSPALVILEIGGNDLLGSTTAEEYAAALSRLINVVKHEERQLVMFELPLPLLHFQYGRAQRRIAREHDVQLIPKRFLGRLLRQPSMTEDGLHLSTQGHQELAELTWKIIKPAFSK